MKNIERSLSEADIEQEDKLDPFCPHIQGIYEFFLQLVDNEAVIVKNLKDYVTLKFIQDFLKLF